jgi:hypothetical protein
MGLAVVPAGQAEAKKSVPFKGFIQADEESFPLFPPDVPFPTLFVDASGSGVATQLGKFTVTYDFEVNLDTFFGVGSAEYVAANGDRVFTEGQGQGTVQLRMALRLLSKPISSPVVQVGSKARPGNSLLCG